MKPQLTLGQLIDKLKAQPADNDVQYGFGYLAPSTCYSYRGYYDQLALDYQNEKTLKVFELLVILEQAVGKQFSGYKGGEFLMTRNTPVWVALHNESGGTAVVGVKDHGYCTQIKTKLIP